MSGDGVVTRLGTLHHNNVSRVLEVAAHNDYDLQLELKKVDVEGRLAFHNRPDLPRDVYHLFLTKALELTDIPAFGIHVGQMFSLVDYGVLGYACISSPTLKNLLDTFFRFQQIVGSGTHFRETLVLKGDIAVIEIQSQCSTKNLEYFEVEQAIGQWVSATREVLLGDVNIFTQINLARAKPPYSNEMKKLLGCPIEFGCARNEMFFPAHLLNRPIRMANKLTSELCEKQCATILDGLIRQRGIVDQVRRHIINLPGEVPTPDKIADLLHMSYRTMRRKLKEEGTSFREIYSEVRMGMAAEYMRQTELTTQEIGFLLGYSETSNFHRAFKARYKQTPSEYRLTQRGAL